jgi:hypothetical protein
MNRQSSGHGIKRFEKAQYMRQEGGHPKRNDDGLEPPPPWKRFSNAVTRLAQKKERGVATEDLTVSEIQLWPPTLTFRLGVIVDQSRIWIKYDLCLFADRVALIG